MRVLLQYASKYGKEILFFPKLVSKLRNENFTQVKVNS